MSNYILSTDVKHVYPAVGRDAEVDITAGLNTEYNLTNILKNLNPNNNGSFIITASSTVNPFEFVVRGFYFNIGQTLSTIANNLSSSTVYATIAVKEPNFNENISDYQSLVNFNDKTPNLDSENYFQGVYFSSSIPSTVSSATYYTLPLLINGTIPFESTLYAPVALEAARLKDAKTINLGTDLTGSVAFDGSTSVTLNATITNSSVTPAKLQYKYNFTDITFSGNSLVITTTSTKTI